MRNQILFYILNKQDNSLWGIQSIDNTTSNRLGWLNGKCIDTGSNQNIYIGADIGVDAEYVFTFDNWDVSKNINQLKPKEEK